MKWNLLILFFLALKPIGLNAADFLEWKHLADLPPVGEQSDPLGVAGPYVGVSNDVLIVAGGANFSKPYWGEDKVWHDDIGALNQSGDWTKAGSLPWPLAYGASVSTDLGVLCMGGNDASRTYSEVFLIKWNSTAATVQLENLPSLPKTIAFTAAATIGSKVYLAGGTETNDLSSAMKNFWVLDVSKISEGWKELPAWPGPSRAFNVVVAQNNGEEDQIFVFSGRRENENGEIQFLKDGYAYSPSSNSWRRVADSPVCFMAGLGFPAGENHIMIVGGADGSLFLKRMS